MNGRFRKNVISASRRTDIPAFYMEWFMKELALGRFVVENPYSGQTFNVPVSPEITDTLVFWSKNFGPFLSGGFGETLQAMGYHLFFNFTINSEDPVLEPEVPPLDARLDQLSDLTKRFGTRSVNWRFDPICHYRYEEGPVRHNLGDIRRIAESAGRCGVERCITSFADLYRKVRSRESRIPGFAFVDPPAERKIEILTRMESLLSGLGIRLSLCCEKELIQHLPVNSTISESACISTTLIRELYGGDLSLAHDQGQRKAKGCGCQVSKDIGTYTLHPCGHNCLFCYANPVDPAKVKP
jgi:hypothetical protein